MEAPFKNKPPRRSGLVSIQLVWKGRVTNSCGACFVVLKELCDGSVFTPIKVYLCVCVCVCVCVWI